VVGGDIATGRLSLAPPEHAARTIGATNQARRIISILP
jgi:hypothetical protein